MDGNYLDPVHRLRIHHGAGGGAAGAERLRFAGVPRRRGAVHSRGEPGRRLAAPSIPRASRRTPSRHSVHNCPGRAQCSRGTPWCGRRSPGDLGGHWKQRLRWARGNVQISLDFSSMWLRGRRYRATRPRALRAHLVQRAVHAAAARSPLPLACLACSLLDARHSLTICSAPCGSFRPQFVCIRDGDGVCAGSPDGLGRAWRQADSISGRRARDHHLQHRAPANARIFWSVPLKEPASRSPTASFGHRLFVYTWLAGSLLVAYTREVDRGAVAARRAATRPARDRRIRRFPLLRDAGGVSARDSGSSSSA